MKKLIMAAVLILTTGVLSSQSKTDNTQRANIAVQNGLSANKKDLASGD